MYWVPKPLYKLQLKSKLKTNQLKLQTRRTDTMLNTEPKQAQEHFPISSQSSTLVI